MSSPPAGAVRPEILVSLFIVATVTLTGALFVLPVDNATVKLASEAGSLVTAISLFVALLAATRRSVGLDRLAWALMFVPTAIGLVSYGVDPLDPSATVVRLPAAFVIGPVVTLAQVVAIAVFARTILRQARPFALLLNSVWLALGVLLVTWNLVGGPVLSHPTLSTDALVPLIAQSLTSAFLIGFIATVLPMANSQGRRKLAWASAPAVMLAVGQTAFGYDFVRGALRYGSFGDFLFPLVFGVAAIAVVMRPSTATISTRIESPSARAMAITWIPLGAWALTALLVEASLLPDQKWLGAVVIGIGVLRLSYLAYEVSRLAERLHHQTMHDPLTGLPNRSMLADLVAHVGDNPAGLLMIDLDRFKAVNDTLGHLAGDELLILVSRRIANAAGSGWTIVRMAGDEFVGLSTKYTSLDDVVGTGHKIVERLSLPFHLDGREAWIGASIGAAATEDELHCTELLDVADLALRTAKDGAKGEVVTADGEVRRRARDRGDLEEALRHAVDRDELFSLYQPKVDLTNGAMLGLEALVRWQRPGVGVVPPGEFIAVAEASGLIARVDSWVFADAVGNLRRWNEMRGNARRLKLSTNMSAWQLARIDVDDEVARAIAWEGGVDPAQLTIELTETLLIEDPEVVARRLRRIAETGVGVSVDDFGAGFTSVAYLRKFPISEVKIDRALVWELTGGPEDEHSLAAAVIALARAMNLEVVAEGVETAEQASALRRLGCRVAQGFLFAKPLPVADIEEILLEPFPFAHLLGEVEPEPVVTNLH